MPIYPTEGTQERMVLDILLDAKGDWVNKTYFIFDKHLTQSGRAIFNLENRFHWVIRHSPFTDSHGFKSYSIDVENHDPKKPFEPVKFPSESKPGLEYMVYEYEGDLACSCFGYQYAKKPKTCRHIEKVRGTWKEVSERSSSA